MIPNSDASIISFVLPSILYLKVFNKSVPRMIFTNKGSNNVNAANIGDEI